VDLIRESLHILEDNTMYVPAALAKLAYAPGDALRRKVGRHRRSYVVCSPVTSLLQSCTALYPHTCVEGCWKLRWVESCPLLRIISRLLVLRWFALPSPSWAHCTPQLKPRLLVCLCLFGWYRVRDLSAADGCWLLLYDCCSCFLL